MKTAMGASASQPETAHNYLVNNSRSSQIAAVAQATQKNELKTRTEASPTSPHNSHRMILLQERLGQPPSNHTLAKGVGGRGAGCAKTRNQTAAQILMAAAGALILAAGLTHAAKPPQQSAPPQNSAPNAPNSTPNMQDMPGMPGMNTGNNKAGSAGDHTEADAVASMEPGHMHMMGLHMRMTNPRPATPQDWARADEIANTLGASIEKYKDYRVALEDGYRIFLPNIPQSQYHFTNYYHGFLEGFTFDPARPTSLLYKKTKTGSYELVGAMYTASKTATPEQLNERIPLSIASWHAHTNLCLPKTGAGRKMDWSRFGLEGPISTLKECREAGGLFYPQVFGWMVHVYPFEPTREKIWGQDMGEHKLDHVPAP